MTEEKWVHEITLIGEQLHIELDGTFTVGAGIELIEVKSRRLDEWISKEPSRR